jgi:hypothetical protein
MRIDQAQLRLKIAVSYLPHLAFRDIKRSGLSWLRRFGGRHVWA